MILALLLQMSALPEDLLARASSRLSAVSAVPRTDSRYRVDGDAAVEDGKQRALETTGGQCQVVGARMCTRKPRTWLKAELPQ